MRVANHIMKKKFDSKPNKKMMSCNFSKLANGKDDDSDNIIDDRDEAQDDENEKGYVAKEMPEGILVLNVPKLDD